MKRKGKGEGKGQDEGDSECEERTEMVNRKRWKDKEIKRGNK